MKTYFADTWYFIASLDRSDQHHTRALRLTRMLVDQRLITHEYVIGEFLTYFSGEGMLARERAVKTVRGIHRSHEVVKSSPIFELALNHYSRRLDKEYSFVD